jgi:hypothetical protein
MEMITYKQITKKDGMARSTIMRRMKAIGKSPVKLKNTKGAGQPSNAIDIKTYQLILDFKPNMAKKKNVYKTAKEKSENNNHFTQFTAKRGNNERNRKRGLYHRLTDYPGVLSWE